MRIDEMNYVDKAENAIKKLTEESRAKNKGQLKIVTTSKIRNLTGNDFRYIQSGTYIQFGKRIMT